MDVCDFDNDDDEDDDIVYLLQGSVHKFGLHASVNAPLVPEEAQSSFLFFSPLSPFHSISSVLMLKRIFLTMSTSLIKVECSPTAFTIASTPRVH